MKFMSTLVFIMLGVLFLMDMSKAAPKLRQKRALKVQECPTNQTIDECLAEAIDEEKGTQQCLSVYKGVGHTLTWESCISIFCGGNTKLIKPDLSKPYPECCDGCEFISKSS